MSPIYSIQLTHICCGVLGLDGAALSALPALYNLRLTPVSVLLVTLVLRCHVN